MNDEEVALLHKDMCELGEYAHALESSIIDIIDRCRTFERLVSSAKKRVYGLCEHLEACRESSDA